MKLLTALLGLLAIFFSVGPAAADPEDTNLAMEPRMLPGVINWHDKCLRQHDAVANAIRNFCAQAGLSNHVPRAWSSFGIASDDGKFPRPAYAAIAGSCSPQQWVPRKYCYLQFYKMCVDFPVGTGDRWFGTGGVDGRGCQHWHLGRAIIA